MEVSIFYKIQLQINHRLLFNIVINKIGWLRINISEIIFKREFCFFNKTTCQCGDYFTIKSSKWTAIKREYAALQFHPGEGVHQATLIIYVDALDRNVWSKYFIHFLLLLMKLNRIDKQNGLYKTMLVLYFINLFTHKNFSSEKLMQW